MKLLAWSLAASIAATPLSGVAQEQYQQLEADQLEQIVREVDAYQAQRQQQVVRLQDQVALLSQTMVAGPGSIDESEGQLTPNLAAALVRLSSASDADLVDVRYQAGEAALVQVRGALNTLNFIHGSMILEGDVGLSTNLWAEEDFRNSWDKVSDWGSILGSAAAAYFLMDGESANAGVSIGVSGIASLVGSILGTQNGGQAAKKIAYIDLSRRAYDDIRERNDLLKGLVEKNDATLRRLETFGDGSFAAAATTQEKLEALAELQAFLNEFELALDQVLTVLSHYSVILDSYETIEVTEEVRGRLKAVEAKVDDMRTRYETQVRRFLAITPELRQQLTGSSL